MSGLTYASFGMIFFCLLIIAFLYYKISNLEDLVNYGDTPEKKWEMLKWSRSAASSALGTLRRVNQRFDAGGIADI